MREIAAITVLMVLKPAVRAISTATHVAPCPKTAVKYSIGLRFLPDQRFITSVSTLSSGLPGA